MFSNSKSMSLHRNPDGFRKSPSNLPAHLGESRIRCQISDFSGCFSSHLASGWSSPVPVVMNLGSDLGKKQYIWYFVYNILHTIFRKKYHTQNIVWTLWKDNMLYVAFKKVLDNLVDLTCCKTWMAVDGKVAWISQAAVPPTRSTLQPPLVFLQPSYNPIQPSASLFSPPTLLQPHPTLSFPHPTLL